MPKEAKAPAPTAEQTPPGFVASKRSVKKGHCGHEERIEVEPGKFVTAYCDAKLTTVTTHICEHNHPHEG